MNVNYKRAQKKQETTRIVNECLKLTYVVLNEEFGFGAIRLQKFQNFMMILINQVSDDPDLLFLVDKKLKQLKINNYLDTPLF